MTCLALVVKMVVDDAVIVRLMGKDIYQCLVLTFMMSDLVVVEHHNNFLLIREVR